MAEEKNIKAFGPNETESINSVDLIWCFIVAALFFALGFCVRGIV